MANTSFWREDIGNFSGVKISEVGLQEGGATMQNVISANYGKRSSFSNQRCIRSGKSKKLKLLESDNTINVQIREKEQLFPAAKHCRTAVLRNAAKTSILNYGADRRMFHSAAGKSIKFNFFYKNYITG